MKRTATLAYLRGTGGSSTTKLCMTTLSSRPAPTCRSPTTRRPRRRSQSAVACNSSPFQWILALKSRIDRARRGLKRAQARAKIQISPISRFSRWVAHMYQVYSQLRVYRSGGEFPNREFPRSGIDGNSSGIPFSKMAFSGNSSEFPYRGGIFNLQGGIVLFTGRGLFIAPLKNPYLRLQNQMRMGA